MANKSESSGAVDLRQNVAPLRLTSLPQALLGHYGGYVPPYREIYTDAVNGKLPVTQKRGRWYWQMDDMPKIAAVYGLIPMDATKLRRVK